jgi:hypothetical protein
MIWQNPEQRIEGKRFDAHLEITPDGTQIMHSITPQNDFVFDMWKPVYKDTWL